MPLRWLIGPLSVLGVVCAISACGSSGSAKASVSASAGATIALPTVPSTLAQVHATGGGAFCTEIANGLNSERNLTQAPTPAELRSRFADIEAKLHAAVKDAPGDIRPDLTVVANATVQFGDALGKANWDFTKLDANATAGITTPLVTAATTRLTTWVKAHCGIDVGASTP